MQELLKWLNGLDENTKVMIAVGAICLTAVASTTVGGLIAFQFYKRRQQMKEWLAAALRKRGQKVRRKRYEREQTISAMIGDYVTDYIEDLVYTEIITRDEAFSQYRKLRRAFPKSRDAAPSPLLVKDKIKRRLSKTEDYIPVKLPPDNPKEEKPKPKRQFMKA